MLSRLYFYAAAIGAAILAALAGITRINHLKHQRDKLKDKTRVLEARVHINDVEKKIKRKEKENLLLKEEEISKKIKEEGEDFEGLDNLSNPNDF